MTVLGALSSRAMALLQETLTAARRDASCLSRPDAEGFAPGMTYQV
ncbi:MAG: hypothetical protein ABI579_02510 [Candidatus Sumerlaeota bacterium]